MTGRPTREIPRRGPEQKLWSRVRIVGDWWLWQGGKTPVGYGMLGWHGQVVYAHRLAYTLAVGPIPDRFLVCHHCDERLCINPAHLFVGTAADNTHDAMRKGRVIPGPAGFVATTRALRWSW